MNIGRIKRLVPVLLLAAGTLALGGCGDEDESGPGALAGTVSSSTPLGAVVLMVDGEGIDQIRGTNGTKAFVGPTNGTSRQVALVGTGELTFSIEVDDVSRRPAIVPQSAADTNNQPIPSLNGIDVGVSTR